MYAQKPLLHRRQKAHRPGQLRTIALDVTSKCNMSCPHCYAETFARVRPVSLQTLARAAEQAYELGVHHYVLQGGEPITDLPRLEGVLKMIRPDETYINVVSNGWSMTRERIQWLRDLQVDKIAFSLDSGIEAEHDRNRRKGSHGRVLKAIDDVRAEGLFTSISTVVTHQSLHAEGFRRALAFAAKEQIRIDVQIAMPVGKWDSREEVLIDAEDAAFIKGLQQEYPVLPNGQHLINRDIYNFGGGDHCPAGSEFMGITADGQVLPCNFAQFSLGRIGRRDLGEMRAALMRRSWFQGHHPCCLLGEDRDFIARFVRPYRQHPKPLDAWELFELKEGGKDGQIV